MTLEQLLKDYWAQLTLVLAGVGYLVRKGQEERARKREINHEQFQQNRITALNDYLGCYSRVAAMWKMLTVSDAVNRRISPKELDAFILPSLHDFKRATLMMGIYFKGGDLSAIKQVYDNMAAINNTLMQIYFDYDTETKGIARANEFEFKKEAMVRDSEQLLEHLANRVRILFSQND